MPPKRDNNKPNLVIMCVVSMSKKEPTKPKGAMTSYGAFVQVMVDSSFLSAIAGELHVLFSYLFFNKFVTFCYIYGHTACSKFLWIMFIIMCLRS